MRVVNPSLRIARSARFAGVAVVGALTILALAFPAPADVILNMPPSKKRPSHAMRVIETAVAETAETEQADDRVGQIALYRYSSARTGTYNNYYVGRRWSGWDYYWEDDFWGWGFPAFFHCGKFPSHHHHGHASCSVPRGKGSGSRSKGFGAKGFGRR